MESFTTSSISSRDHSPVTARRVLRWVVPALVIVAAGIALTVALPRLRSLAGRRNGDSAADGALEERVAALEARLRRSESAAASPTLGVSHTVVPTATEPPLQEGEQLPRSTRVPQKGRSADEDVVQNEYFDSLDVRLATEAPDPAWSAVTVEKLRAAVHELRPQMSLGAAQCGRSMCRVEATVTDPREAAPVLERFLVAAGPLLPEAIVRDVGEPARRIVYFGRRVGEFPPMEVPPEALGQ
jgi:type II secretory pathway pseudopilin PulG